MKTLNIQTFEMKNAVLRYDMDKSILTCGTKYNDRKLWVKKLNDLYSVSGIIEDDKKYYLACDSGEINGQFLAVKKQDGTTEWFIPGKSFLHVIYNGFLYLIFADENNRFYLLKVHLSNGKSSWFHHIEQDLSEYSFADNKITLHFLSGEREVLSVANGQPVQRLTSVK
jgi:hypothetical protein